MSTTIIPHTRNQPIWTRRTRHVAGFLLETFPSNHTPN